MNNKKKDLKNIDNFFSRISNKVRLIPDYLRGYSFSDPVKNGEYKFLREYIKSGMLVFDIGANIGEYSRYILGVDSSVKIHCFEPVKETYDKLVENLRDEIITQKVISNNLGLSNENKTEEIFIYGSLAGSNSLYYNKKYVINSVPVMKQVICLSTLDEYVSNSGIKKIDLLKIDVEGHELNVLQGARESLKKNIIKCIQFEYGDFWKISKSKLFLVFDMLKDQYIIYRLTPWGKVKIRRFKTHLENYKYSNFVAFNKFTSIS